MDPGPRGIRLGSFERLKQAGGVAPAGWRLDGPDWWVEEHGLVMEPPVFPLPAGKYLVTRMPRVRGEMQHAGEVFVGAAGAEGSPCGKRRPIFDLHSCDWHGFTSV